MKKETNGDNLVSIIIPVYNVREYVERCIESALHQTYTSLEIIVIDDGSTDGSSIICDNMKKKDSRVQVCHQENRGLSAARNTGLKMATGKYIYFLDSDDYIEEYLIADAVTILDEKGYDLVTFGYRKWMGDKCVGKTSFEKKLIEFHNQHEFAEYMNQHFIYYKTTWEVWGKVFRKDIIDAYGIVFEPTEKVCAEDICFDLMYLLHCKTVYETGKQPHNYVIRPESLSNSYQSNHINECFELLHCFEQHIQENQIPISKKDEDSIKFVWLNYEMRAVSTKALKNGMCDIIIPAYSKRWLRKFTIFDCIRYWGWVGGIKKYIRTKLRLYPKILRKNG